MREARMRGLCTAAAVVGLRELKLAGEAGIGHQAEDSVEA